MRRLPQLALVAMLFLVVALGSALVTMRLAIHGAEVVVPDLRGMRTADANRRAAALDLTLTGNDRYFSAAVAAGRVLSQFPPPGTAVRRGWHLHITECLGPQTAAIPGTLQQDDRMAEMAVRRAGLRIGTVAHMPYGAQAGDTVIAQSPGAGATDAAQPEVSLLLSTPAPAETEAYVMPDLRNRSGTAAAAAIAHAGLKLAPLVYQDVAISAVGRLDDASTGAPLPPVLRGTVVSQSPDPGKRITASTPIVLTVAR